VSIVRGSAAAHTAALLGLVLLAGCGGSTKTTSVAAGGSSTSPSTAPSSTASPRPPATSSTPSTTASPGKPASVAPINHTGLEQCKKLVRSIRKLSATARRGLERRCTEAASQRPLSASAKQAEIRQCMKFARSLRQPGTRERAERGCSESARGVRHTATKMSRKACEEAIHKYRLSPALEERALAGCRKQ